MGRAIWEVLKRLAQLVLRRGARGAVARGAAAAGARAAAPGLARRILGGFVRRAAGGARRYGPRALKFGWRVATTYGPRGAWAIAKQSFRAGRQLGRLTSKTFFRGPALRFGLRRQMRAELGRGVWRPKGFSNLVPKRGFLGQMWFRAGRPSAPRI